MQEDSGIRLAPGSRGLCVRLPLRLPGQYLLIKEASGAGCNGTAALQPLRTSDTAARATDASATVVPRRARENRGVIPFRLPFEA